MLYARVDEKSQWPNEWDEVQDMFKYLNRMVWGYQLILEKKMFATQFGMEYRGVLVRWNGKQYPETNRREVLLETDDPAQMKATLFMLINEAEVEYKAAKQQAAW